MLLRKVAHLEIVLRFQYDVKKEQRCPLEENYGK
jgi:hypothetical protein